MLYMRFEHINFGIEVSENVEVLSIGNLVEEDTVVVFYFVDENFRVISSVYRVATSLGSVECSDTE